MTLHSIGPTVLTLLGPFLSMSEQYIDTYTSFSVATCRQTLCLAWLVTLGSASIIPSSPCTSGLVLWSVLTRLSFGYTKPRLRNPSISALPCSVLTTRLTIVITPLGKPLSLARPLIVLYVLSSSRQSIWFSSVRTIVFPLRKHRQKAFPVIPVWSATLLMSAPVVFCLKNRLQVVLSSVWCPLRPPFLMAFTPFDDLLPLSGPTCLPAPL